MNINYDIYVWWTFTAIFSFLIAIIYKKFMFRYMRNEHGHLKKSERNKIQRLYKNINYFIILAAILSFVFLTVFFGINITTIHKTVKEIAMPTTESPSAVQISDSNQQLEDEIVRKRSEKINIEKKKAQDEYDQFLKDAVNRNLKEE